MKPVELKIADLFISGDHARKVNTETTEFNDLAKSIAKSGVQIAVIVRKDAKRENKYELLAGQRRLAACKKNKMETIPAEIRTLTDQEASDITFFENYAREDLTAIEQSEAVCKWLKIYKDDAKAVASKLGMTVHMVKVRAQLKNLIPSWKDMIRKKGSYNIPLTLVEKIARLPIDLQKNLYSSQGEGLLFDYNGNIKTAKQLDTVLNEYTYNVKTSPWNNKDETLYPAAGTCEDCNNRTDKDVQFDLFNDDQVSKKQTIIARCLDPKCWTRKLDAHITRRKKELAENHKNIIFIIDNYNDKDHKKRIYHNHNVAEVPKKTKGALPAFVLDGKGAGNLRWVKLNSWIEKPKSQSKLDEKGEPTPAVSSLKERRDKLNRKRWAQVIQDLIKKLEEDLKTTIFDNDTLIKLAAVFGTATKQEHFGMSEWKKFKSPVQATVLLYDQIKSLMIQRLTLGGTPITQTPPAAIQEARNVAELFGIKIDDLFDDVSKRKGFTEPKGWALLGADGSVKKKDTKKAKKK